ncbi:MAG TPA: hypothetical protein VMZ69_03595 [Saprospiraceae bacterium]|nr:hypothetical protein [Saprospiraceae bacterium]
MEFISALWMPILLSAVFVFIVSSIIHMVLGYHANDHQKLPDEDRAMDAIRALNIPPGHYAMPKPGSMKDYKSEEFKAKQAKGPVMFMHVYNSNMGMGKSLVQWFLYCIVVGIFSAYIASHTINPDADYLTVHRVVGCTAFMGYGLALVQDAIWGQNAWGATWKSVFDALLFGLVTGGTFGWLWP